MAPKLKDSRGRLTAYAFACGYVESDEPAKLWREHGVYHVNGINPVTGVRFWESYRTLTEARKGLRTLGNIHGLPRKGGL